jgi:5-methylcytosine-specific restriction endonuclease McrA
MRKNASAPAQAKSERSEVEKPTRDNSRQSEIPDLDWYTGRSRQLKLPPRCPIATSELCPRYYYSWLLLGRAEVTTPISAADQARLGKKWATFPSVVAEEGPSTFRAGEKFPHLLDFCPEVNYQVFGLFASSLDEYADEIDRDVAYRRLEREGAPGADPRWRWCVTIPRHYSECREFSIFSDAALAGPPKASKVRSGVPARVRWLVFSRDSFACKYCGRRPPEVVLQVDHVVSVKAGGGDEPDNLVTSCADCNLGKGADSKTGTP